MGIWNGKIFFVWKSFIFLWRWNWLFFFICMVVLVILIFLIISYWWLVWMVRWWRLRCLVVVVIEIKVELLNCVGVLISMVKVVSGFWICFLIWFIMLMIWCLFIWWLLIFWFMVLWCCRWILVRFWVVVFVLVFGWIMDLVLLIRIC